jgi:hypothetical protein
MRSVLARVSRRAVSKYPAQNVVQTSGHSNFAPMAKAFTGQGTFFEPLSTVVGLAASVLSINILIDKWAGVIPYFILPIKKRGGHH